MRWPLLVPLLLLPVALVAAWSWLQPTEPAPELAFDEAVATATHPDAAGDPADAAMPVDDIGEFDRALPSDAHAADPDDEPERDEVASPGEARGPRVRVLRGSPPMPVEGAAVAFVVAEVAKQQRHEQRLPPLREAELPEQHGHLLVTDANGLVRLPPHQAPLLVSASHDGAFAIATIRPGQRQAELRLVQDETLRVLVRGFDSAPAAGIPVAIHQGVGFDKAETIWEAATGSDGIAVVHHFQLYRRNERERQQDRFAAVVVGAFSEPVALEFAGRPATTELLVLHLPPRGELAIRLVDRTKTPILSPASLRLLQPRTPGQDPALPLAGDYGGVRRRKDLGSEPVPFAPLGLGLPLQLGGRFDGSRGGFRIDLVGPAHSDGPVAVDAMLPADWSVLAGTLRDAAGNPVAMPAEGVLLLDAANAMPVRALPLADGRFDILLPARTLAAPTLLELRGPTPAPAAATPGVRVQVRALGPGERCELGVLRLSPLADLASGFVVDDIGAPIANADVRVQRLTRTRRRDQEQVDAQDLPLSTTRSGEDGAFRISGALPAGELRLRATADGHKPAEAALTGQGNRFQLVLQRTGVLRGRVTLPDWIADESASLQLRPRDPAMKNDARGTPLRHRRGGQFAVGDLRPGLYDAVLSLRNLPEPIVVLPQVAIAPGDNRDARLDGLALGSLVFRYRLRALGPDGRELPYDLPVLARVPRADGQRADVAFRLRGGKGDLILGANGIDVVVFGRGIAPRTLSLYPGDHDLWLTPLPPATIHVPGLRSLVGAERSVRVSMILAANTGLPESLSGVDQRSGEGFSFARWDLGKSNGGWLDQFDTAVVPLQHSGKYEVVLRIGVDARQDGPQGSVALGTIDVVLDGSKPPFHTLPLPTNEIANVLREQQRRAQAQQQRPGGDGRNRR